MKNDKLFSYINGRSCGILGLGVSNLPLAEQLHQAGIPLTVYDKKAPSELGEKAEVLQKNGVRFVGGDSCFDSLNEALLFRSPGIRPDRSGLAAAVRNGSELTGEIELFLRLTDANTFAVTGSDGKTTSTTLTYRFLEAESKRTGIGKTIVGGNIGSPLLNRLSEITEQDSAVLELSSFQLMTLTRAPRYAAITNLSPNHLDWHRDMEEYRLSKCKIIGPDTVRFVTNADCSATADIAERVMQNRPDDHRPSVYLFSSQRTSFEQLFPNGAGSDDRAVYIKDGCLVISDGKAETPVLELSRIRIPGRHNAENFMTAIALTDGQVSPEVYGTVADDFCGVKHRLEWVRNVRGVDYYNSSIDSSPTRTAAALSALNGRNIVVICGGYDKKIPFEPLADALCRSAQAVVLTGATAEKIYLALQHCPDYRNGNPTVAFARSLEEAVSVAATLAQKDGCVLLSPACASFDAFKNFAERGNRFCEIVNALDC